ncbi:LysR family transcriptional regulator [Endozoicomonadaceae bacterium StTr2]
MDKFEAMRVFVTTAESESFVIASRKLNLSAPTITRSVAQLEQSLGVRLFNRTTRHVRLTEAGIRYYDDAKHILELIETADATASGVYAEPKGTLTVTAPVLFGQKHVIPIINDYLRDNPAVNVNAMLYDRVTNILDEGIDVAIRIGHLKDSSLFAVHVGNVRQVLCAAPTYLQQHGVPERPADLTRHQIIQASTVEASTTWGFDSANGKVSVKVAPRLVCNQNGAVVRAAEDGLGITRLMSYQVGKECQQGSLVRVLQDYEAEPLPVHIIYLEGRQASAKVKAFVDMAVERLRANPFINHLVL